MEDIIKLEALFAGRFLSKETIFRVLAVLTGVILLCLCVEVQSSRYQELMKRKVKHAKSSIGSGMSCDGYTELYLELAGKKDLLKNGTNMYNPDLAVTGYVDAERFTDDIETIKEVSVKAEENMHFPETGVMKRVPEVAEGEKDSPAAEIPKTEEPSEGRPIAVAVTAYGNGGLPEVEENTYDVKDFTADILNVPKRPGKMFTGWYEDAEGLIPFTGLAEDRNALTLYAGWSDFPGFISNDSGYIIGCTEGEDAVFGGLLVLPSHESCIGVERGAFDGQEDLITDVYIPANITYIEPGTFDDLPYLMFIEAAPGNPVYSSEKGILYDSAGNVAAYPAGRNNIGR